MDKLLLIKPDESYLDEISSYRNELIESGSSMDGCGTLKDTADPREWLQFNKLLSDKNTLPENWVQSTQFIYVRECDKRIVGMIQVRHYFNDFLEKYGGNIGYSVRPSERHKGYAKNMLHDLLPYCRNIGIKKILITCDDDNEGSRKTILANGGVYESTVYEEDDNCNLQRFWINLKLNEDDLHGEHWES